MTAFGFAFQDDFEAGSNISPLNLFTYFIWECLTIPILTWKILKCIKFLSVTRNEDFLLIEYFIDVELIYSVMLVS